MVDFTFAEDFESEEMMGIVFGGNEENVAESSFAEDFVKGKVLERERF